ncbi:MAG TPA: glycosyltransferase family 4 protein [Myxococcales bacterium]|jgi:glycosyltransferase involved in cell wall biosynthesis
MRIYVFAEHFPNTYKPYYDAQLADWIDEGHELRVFAFGKFDRTRNATVDELALDRKTTYCPSTLRSLPSSAPGLLAELASRPGTIGRAIHATWHGDLPAKLRLLDAARSVRLPDESPDLCLIHNLVTAQSFGFLERVYPSARVALYFHGGEIPEGGTIVPGLARRAFERAHIVFTNTGYSSAEASARGCPPGKIVICPVGFRVGEYRPAVRKRYREDGLLRLLTVGRLGVEKGLGHALDAARALLDRGVKNFRLRMIGDGPQRAALEARVLREGLGRHVRLVGELPHHALHAEYRAADALLLPSIATPRWEENQGCVMQEAMLMKLAVVSTRTGGVQESLAPELRRFSVEPEDGAAIAKRIEELLALDEEELRRLGAGAREFAAARYDVRALNRRLVDEVLSRRRGPASAPDAVPA